MPQENNRSIADGDGQTIAFYFAQKQGHWIHAASLPHFDSMPFSKLGPTGPTQDGGAAVATQRQRQRSGSEEKRRRELRRLFFVPCLAKNKVRCLSYLCFILHHISRLLKRLYKNGRNTMWLRGGRKSVAPLRAHSNGWIAYHKYAFYSS